MGSAKICMNGLCGTTTSAEWLKGWALKKGGFATLCSTCGPPYTRGTYCQRFHLNEPGWRQCKYCEQPIHCGCIVSTYTYDFLDMGGVACLPCINRKQQGLPRPHWISRDDVPNGFAGLGTFGNCQSSVLSNRINIASVSSGIPAHLNEVEKQKSCIPTPLCNNEPTSCTGQFKQEENMHTAGDYGTDLSSGKIEKEVGISFPSAEFGTIFPHLLKSIPSSIFPKPDHITPTLGLKDMNEALPQPSLSFSPLGTPNSLLPVSGGIVEGREQSKVPSFKQGQRTRHILPKPSKSGTSTRAQANKGMVSQNRVARPPAEGRGRNQLLPRYWPRITDQELEQISGDLNCTIVPLFEKVLSASDAGRIGRLVLPKACAEAYFPPISQSEGLPIRIQDIKGQEWTFQFRFWPNNNSRMYVLEGVTPCIQNMQLQAGDTVTFSRLEPGSKLVIGCRKAAASIDSQEAEPSALPNGLSGETSLPTPNENLTAKNEEHEGMTNGDPPVLNPEKKRTRNIGSKSKRLLMHSEDAMELRVTWEEAQELLRPASSSKPNVIVIENQEFEEYDEPPVFGKRTIFTEQTSGSQEQWGQCDSCSKWRKIPVDVLLPPKWSCADNVWDPNRCSCSAPDEINTRDLERISRTGKELKRRRMAERRVSDEIEPTGLDALATAAVLGDATGGGSGESSVGPTTRHPRHRPGCTCIVCIQPPSGKGKHKPTCICNVCLTVKRRFKTLMLRKKKRQAELAQGKENQNEEDISASVAPLHNNELSIGVNNLLENGREMEAGESSSGKGQVLDLNCDPNSNRDEEMITLAEAEGMTMAFTSLVRVADLPIGWPYSIGQSSGLSNLVPCENEGQPSDDNPGDEES